MSIIMLMGFLLPMVATPHKHLFTYVNGLVSDGTKARGNNCPCARYPGTPPPHFVVQGHCYCESGSLTVHTSELLWDDYDCNPGNSCRSLLGMPWIYI